MFFYIGNLNFYFVLTKGNFNDIIDFDIIRGFCGPSVYGNVSGIAGFIGDRTSFYNSGNFQVFIESHGKREILSLGNLKRKTFGGNEGAAEGSVKNYLLLTAAFRALPAVKVGCLEAGMVISLPV